MNKRSTVRLILTFCFFAFIATVSAYVRPAMAQCDSVTDAQMVSDIYGRIKADKVLAPQVSHINVTVTNGVIKLQGWADTKKDFDKVISFASNETCARMINQNSFYDAPPAEGDSLRASGGCTSGTKACGDVCIPSGDTCNITTGAKP